MGFPSTQASTIEAELWVERKSLQRNKLGWLKGQFLSAATQPGSERTRLPFQMLTLLTSFSTGLGPLGGLCRLPYFRKSDEPLASTCKPWRRIPWPVLIARVRSGALPVLVMRRSDAMGVRGEIVVLSGSFLPVVSAYSAMVATVASVADGLLLCKIARNCTTLAALAL